MASFEFDSSIQELDTDIQGAPLVTDNNTIGITANAAAKEANREAVLVTTASSFTDDSATQLIDPYQPSFSMTVPPGALVDSGGQSFSGSLYLSELTLNVVGPDDAPTIQMGVYAASPDYSTLSGEPVTLKEIRLPNITGAGPGTTVPVETFGATTGKFIGGGSLVVRDDSVFLITGANITIPVN